MERLRRCWFEDRRQQEPTVLHHCGTSLTQHHTIDINKSTTILQYLKPPDLSTSNIFIDQNFNITCIIDWASCFTVPLSTLLITPSFPHPRDGVDVTMIPIFQDSVIQYSAQIKKGVLDPLPWDLAQKSRLFMQLIDLDGLQDYFQFVELYTSVYTDTNETDVRRQFNALREDDVFIEQARTQLKEDPQASEIQQKEKQLFTHRAWGAEALARKLTEDAALDRQFVADSRLWKQVGESLKSQAAGEMA